jgi:hypothetical protein
VRLRFGVQQHVGSRLLVYRSLEEGESICPV